LTSSGNGMTLKRVKNKLIIECPLDSKGRPSSSGKTTLLFSSGGFHWNAELGIGVSVNVCKSKRAA